MESKLTNDSFILHLSRDELTIINNALGYVCEGLDLGSEFETLIGTDIETARALLDEVSSALDSE